MLLSEKFPECFFYFSDRFYFYIQFFAVDAVHSVVRNQYGRKAQFFGFCNSLGYSCYWAYLTAQSHFAGHADVALYRRIDVAGEDGSYDAQVYGWIGDAKASGNVQVNIFLCELEAYTFFKYGQKHVEAAQIESCCRALRRRRGLQGRPGSL